MPKTRPPYAPAFRRQMLDLVRAGRDPTDLAREFEPSSQAIRNWVARADRDEGRREAKPLTFEATLSRPSAMTLPGCAARISSCGWSVIFSLEPWPGSLGRPEWSRPGLRIHEREPGLLPDRPDGARARGVNGRLIRLAEATAIRSCCHGRGAATADQDSARQLPRDLRCTAHSCRLVLLMDRRSRRPLSLRSDPETSSVLAGPAGGSLTGLRRHDPFALVSSPTNHTPAAASIASMPARRVGSVTGAKSGEWLTGSSFNLPAFSACANVSGSMPPTTQNTAGTPHAAATG